jgi:hypothetical protein
VHLYLGPSARSLGTPLWHCRSVGALIVLFTAGCAATSVIPPGNPASPTAVFIVDHGRTSSVVIPVTSGEMLRFAYGDWAYYALGKNDLWHGIAALMWPTRGALGRRELEGPAGLQSIERQVSSIEQVHEVMVELSRVRSFERTMQALYERHRDTEVENRLYGLHFVHHPRRYTYFWNSNHAVAAWLQELGCSTAGWPSRAHWKIEQPASRQGIR